MLNTNKREMLKLAVSSLLEVVFIIMISLMLFEFCEFILLKLGFLNEL